MSFVRKLELKGSTFQPIKSFFSTADILPLCAAANSLRQTQQCHALAVSLGHLPRSVSISAALILSYATHHSPHPSTLHSLFNQTLPFSRSSFLHNNLIRACTILAAGPHKHDDSLCDYGLALYNHLQRGCSFAPDDYTFPFVLKLCADFVRVSKGLEVHGRLVKAGFDGDVFVNNTLMLFYGSCGSLWSVGKVFDEMSDRDLVSWNTVIRVYSDKGSWLEAFEVFKGLIMVSGLLPNAVSVVSILSVSAGIEDGMLVSLIHCYVFKVGLDGEVRIGNGLVDAYGKCGSMDSSKGVFDEMVERNEVSWNSIIGSFAYGGFGESAFRCLREIVSENVKLNTVTIATIVPTLVDLNLVNIGREVHGFSVKMGMDSDVFVANALIDMYGKWRRFTQASNVFHKMNLRNIVSWNSMIGNFAQNGLELDAIRLVGEMQAHGEIPNSVTLTNVLPACARIGSLSHGKEIHAQTIRRELGFEIFVSNALIDMYAKCGHLDLAKHIFSLSLKDEVSYNILIVAHSETSDSSRSISLFAEMEKLGLKQDAVSYMGVLSACASITAIKEGTQIHAFAIRRLFHEHLFVANSLLDLYTKCGRTNTARKIFDLISDKDTASWNTMIMGFGMLGEFDTAINLFEAMREDGIDYDSVSFIAVLSACSHGGLVEKGKLYFDEMLAQNIKPTEMHYACMVDLLGRSGFMEEAVVLINNLKTKPGANVWGALLGASRVHGNVELGCWAAEHLLDLKPDHSGYYVLLANMYAELGRWNEADRVRKLMSDRKVVKNPGCSWVQGRDQVHGFVAGERLDPDLVACQHFG